MNEDLANTEFESGAGGSAGYVARPAGGSRAGVLVLQEWWGLVPHIRSIADRLAAEGFVALAPDLYEGKNTLDAEEAQHLMEGLDWGKARLRMAGAVRHLREKEGCAKVGVTGFCMGGALTVLAAADGGAAAPAAARVDAYCAWYGFPPAPPEELAKVAAPGRIFFGEHEGFFDVPAARRFAGAQAARGIETELRVYPGAGHAFNNDTRPEAYHEPSAKDAWTRMLELFRTAIAA